MRTTDRTWHTDELPQEHTGGSLVCNFGDLAVAKEIVIDDLDLPYNER